MTKEFMRVFAAGHRAWASISAQGMADTIVRPEAMPTVGKLFDRTAPSLGFDGSVITFDIDAIPTEDRATLVPILIEFAAIQAEKRRRKVRFLPAQVIRRIKANLFGDKPGFKGIAAG